MKKVLPCKCHAIDKKGYVYSKLKQISEKGKRGIQTIVSDKWNKLRPITRKVSGYKQVSIHGRTIRVNRLIAQNFLENPFCYPEVHHKNGVKTDNRIENLKWGNQKQNAEDRIKHGNQLRGSNAPPAKLNERKVVLILAKREEGKTLQSIANEYKVSKKLILLIIQNKIWKHVKRD